MRILLATLHAKYVHASLALPCLASSCREIPGARVVVREFTVNEPVDQVLRRIIGTQADLAAFSCYIWNVEQTLRLVSDLKKVRPHTFVILGGPEVSHGTFELMERNPGVDCVVRGEGETAFAACVRAIMDSSGQNDRQRRLGGVPGLVIRGGEEIVATSPSPPISDLDTVPSPFAGGLVDFKKPLVYYETSRGCPFSCAFCMSSLEEGVRSFSMERIRGDLRILLEHRARVIKFVDRTFNYDARRANAIWEYALEHNVASTFHFEIAADLLTNANIELLKRVPEGIFRFEIGVQSGSAETLRRVRRRSDLERLYANVRRLLAETRITIHLDLVAGLPEEDFTGFLESLEQLFRIMGGAEGWSRCHIQVEPLKVLKGSPMRRIAEELHYAYSDAPPYKILQTPWLTYDEICRIETIARLLDIFLNSGRFRASLRVLSSSCSPALLFAELEKFWDARRFPVSLSQKGVFEALWRFGNEFLPPDSLPLLADALVFDFCLVEYPSAGSLPSFFGAEGRPAPPARKARTDGLVERLKVGQDARIRTFAASFHRDFTLPQWPEAETGLTFVYISAPGKGLRVEVARTDEL